MATGRHEGKGGARKVRLSNRLLLGIRAARMKRGEGAAASAGLSTRPHPVYFSGAASWTLFVAVVATLLIRHNDLSRAAEWSVVGWSVLAGASGVVGPVVRWLRTSIDVDATRARCTAGLLRRVTTEVVLDDARDVAVEQGQMGRWLDYGYLSIVDARGQTHVFPPIGGVARVREVLTSHLRRRRPTRGS